MVKLDQVDLMDFPDHKDLREHVDLLDNQELMERPVHKGPREMS